MESGIYQFLGVNYYTHLYGLVFVLPFFIYWVVSITIFLVTLIIKRNASIRWQLTISTLMVLFSVVVVFYDVFITGLKVNSLCKHKAGIHVYKTVVAEGFLGARDIEDYSKYGFTYVEHSILARPKWRFIMEDGEPKKIKVNDFISTYELARLEYEEKITNQISIDKYYVSNRNTGEILGEDVRIFIYPGWADSLFYGITGFSYKPWICSGKDNEVNRRKAIALRTLIPPKQEARRNGK